MKEWKSTSHNQHSTLERLLMNKWKLLKWEENYFQIPLCLRLPLRPLLHQFHKLSFAFPVYSNAHDLK
jgi:hypothetical protein